jgi:hypothetical protein
MPSELVLRTLAHSWRVLEPLGMPMAVMGGIALSAWKHVRATQDVDLLIGIGKADLNLVLRQLAGGQIRPKQDPPVMPLGQLWIVQCLYEPAGAYLDLQIDLLLAESDYHRQALDRRIQMRLPDSAFDVFVLACEDLIIHKLLAGRLIYRADAAALLRRNRTTLDLGLVVRSVNGLGLTRELAEVWEEAFPGERVPVSEP